VRDADDGFSFEGRRVFLRDEAVVAASFLGVALGSALPDAASGDIVLGAVEAVETVARVATGDASECGDSTDEMVPIGATGLVGAMDACT